MIVTLLVILSVLVVAHEWGHFIVARLFGIRVDDFSIGFGKRLFRLAKRGDTEYNVRMLPLGGFVKIAGMEADEEPINRVKDKVVGKKSGDDPDAHELPLVAENPVAAPPVSPAPDEFYAKPLWQRSLVIFAGPLMSFLFGWILLCLIGVTAGLPTGKTLTKVGLVNPGGEGQRVGLQTGDVILAIDGVPMTDGGQIVRRINGSLGQPLIVTIRRDGRTRQLHATPKALKDRAADVVQPGALGGALALRPGDWIRQINVEDIGSVREARETLQKSAGKPVTMLVMRDGQDEPVKLAGRLPQPLSESALPVLKERTLGGLNFSLASEVEHLSLRESIARGNALTLFIITSLPSLLHLDQLRQNAGGIIFMGQATGLAVKSGLYSVLLLMGNLSISLCIFNLLPIPILDGGHLLTFFIEWVRGGKKLTAQQQQNFLMTGLAIIGVLFFLILTNDIVRTVRHQMPQ